MNGNQVDFVSLKRSFSSLSLSSNKRAKTVTNLEVLKDPLNNKLRDLTNISTPFNAETSTFSQTIRRAPPPPKNEDFRVRPNLKRFSQSINGLKKLARVQPTIENSNTSNIPLKPIRIIEQDKNIKPKIKTTSNKFFNFLNKLTPKTPISPKFVIASSSKNPPLHSAGTNLNYSDQCQSIIHLSPWTTTNYTDDLPTINSNDDISPTLRFILGEADIDINDDELDCVIDKFNNEL
ncbi:hypothetical protein CLIB1444_01S00826 [[Candida] jaroonii]|uniref:Uncharacterized protein n=1 Tax=[Candida] jaroonii TaxID=467808 RepID=A0ACA9XZX4_9ASCO|nr:hypothetical protein CLIB1444_01S00826 [[Candida] jaroonii]